ncbi:MAG: hypothetical protein KGR46_00775 [Verrucomicrobia bacterium]|nr:hypothetical protein [Verrucomicrobiota bacterium]
MASVETLLSESDIQKKRRRNMIISIILGVVILHVGAGVIAGIFVVAKYIFPPPANFVVKKDVRLPAKKREHKMNMAALDAAAPKPTISDRMQSTRPTAFSLPALPEIPLDQALPLDPSQLIAENVSSLATADGIGTGGVGSAGAAGFGDKGVSFLGIQSAGSRILIMFDVSKTVKNKAQEAGIPFTKIKDETMTLIDKLPITSRFGIISFGQLYKSFSSDLLPKTKSNSDAVKSWMEAEWESTKNTTKNMRGIVGVLDYAATLKPDLIYLISDGSFQWKPEGKIGDVPWDEFQKAVARLKDMECRVNFISFEPSEEAVKELRRAASRTGGKSLELKK